MSTVVGSHQLGHTLLSIIGSQPVYQPMQSEGAALTFNGEIYNYVELREQDARLRAATTGASDTEVLFEGLRLHGLGFLEKLNGMFAFCFVDERGDAYLVRDRLGIKPLLYRAHAGEVAFASEPEALARLGAARREPDAFGWYSYARARYPIDGASFDVGVHMVPPGHYVRIHGGRITLHEYWRIEPVEPTNASEDVMLDQTMELLADSVRLRMRSDHSFCTFLSGGLDSSLLTAFAASTKSDLQTYSVAVDRAGFDESGFAAAVSQALDTEHVELRLGAEGFSQQAAALWSNLRIPLGVPNVVAIAALAEVMAERHRCVLSGEGADEVFGGYGRIFLLPHDWEMLNGGTGGGDVRDRFRRLYGATDFGDIESLFIDRYSYLGHAEATNVLSPMFSPSEMEVCRERYETAIRARFAEAANTDDFNRLLIVFQRLHLPGLLLRLDTATMAHSVEARVPFLDHRLVQYANSLPIDFKMRRRATWEAAVAGGALSDELSEVHDSPKWPLRRIAADWISDEIIERPKLGFPIPPAFYGAVEGPAMGGYRDWVAANVDEVCRRMG